MVFQYLAACEKCNGEERTLFAPATGSTWMTSPAQCPTSYPNLSSMVDRKRNQA